MKKTRIAFLLAVEHFDSNVERNRVPVADCLAHLRQQIAELFRLGRFEDLIHGLSNVVGEFVGGFEGGRVHVRLHAKDDSLSIAERQQIGQPGGTLAKRVW